MPKKIVSEDHSVTIEGWVSTGETPSLIRISYEGKEAEGITFTLTQARSFLKAVEQQIRNLDAAETAKAFGMGLKGRPGDTLS